MKGGGLVQEFDMEVTDERLSYIKNLLAMLYADQIGAEVKSINVRPVGGGTEREPA